MADTFAVQAACDWQLSVQYSDSDGVVTLYDNWVSGLNLASLKRTLTNGTGANKANKAWRKQSTLAAAANDDWVLGTASANVLDRWKNVVGFTLVQWFFIRITNPATTLKLRLGNFGANAWPAWFGAIAQTEDVQVQYMRCDDIDGWAVTANHTLRVNNPSGSSVTYDIGIVGQG